MGLWRLLARRLFVHPVALVAVVVAVLMSMSVVAVLQLLATDIADASIRSTVDVAEHDRSIAVSAYVRPVEIAPADALIREGLDRALGDVPVSRAAQLTSRGIRGRAETDRAVLAELDGLDRAATLTAGRWPRPAGPEAMAGQGPIEVALPTRAADDLGLAVGDSLVLPDLVDATKPAITVTLVGSYDPTRPEAALWEDDDLSAQGVARTQFTTYGPFVLGTGSLASLPEGAITMSWRAVPRVPVDTSQLDDTRAAVAAGVRDLARAIGAGTGPQGSREAAATLYLRNATIIDQSRPLLDAAAAVAQRVRVALLTPTLLLLLLGSAALVVAAGLLGALRGSEVRLMRIRGASGRQLALLAAADAALVVVFGAAGAALAAPAVADWIGRRSGLSGAGSAPGPRSAWWHVLASAQLWSVLAVMGLLAVLVITITTLRVSRNPGSPGRSARGGPSLAILTGSGLDVLLVALGVLGVVQLRRYAASTATTTTSAIDPLTVAAPTLVIAGLAVLCLRLLPLVVRGAARATEARPGLDLAWGGWQVARRLSEQSGTVLLILLAMAMGTLALAQGATTTRAIEDQSGFEAGSALRVDLASAAWGDPGNTGRMAAAAGGIERVMPVHRASVDLGPLTDVTVLGLDAATAGVVVAPRSDTLGGRSWSALTEDLAAGREVGGGLALAGDPRVLALDLELSTTAGHLIDEGFELGGLVQIRDGRGLVHAVPMGSVRLGASTHEVTLPSDPALPGPLALLGVVLRPPSVASALSSVPNAVQLTVTDVRADGVPIGSLRALRSSSDQGAPALLVPGAKGPLPALVTRDVAAATKAHQGSIVNLGLDGRALSVRVLAVIESFPTARTPTRAVVVDLPSLQAASPTAGTDGRGVAPLPVKEWWLDPTDPAAAATDLAQGLAPGSALVSRAELVGSRVGNQVNAGLRSAMLLVTGAALVLAAVGFAATTAALSRSRRHENAILLALGVAAGRTRRALAVERVALVFATVVTGLGLGLVSAYAVVPLIVSGDGHPQVPEVLVTFSWPGLLTLAGGFFGVLCVVGLIVLRGSGRGLAQELREGGQ